MLTIPSIEAVSDALNAPEISTRPLPEVCRKYGVYLEDIAQLVTFSQDWQAFCNRRKRDLDEAEADLEEYESVCVELDYAINDIAMRRKIEMDNRARLKESADALVLAHDAPYSEGVIHGLELALESLGDLIEGGFGDRAVGLLKRKEK